jgi:nucleoid-associated protein YgaU
MRFFSSPLLVAAVAGSALAFTAHSAQAQAQVQTPAPATAPAKMPEDKSKRPSPPAVVKTTVRGTDVTIDYSRPSLKGREAFGEKSPLAPNGEVWRTGANEATIFTVSKDVKIEGQALAAGTYSLFTIPGPGEWTVIFNKTAKQWGAYDYKAADDVLRVKVKPTTIATPVEQFTITADKSGKVTMAWAKTAASFTVK